MTQQLIGWVLCKGSKGEELLLLLYCFSLCAFAFWCPFLVGAVNTFFACLSRKKNAKIL